MTTSGSKSVKKGQKMRGKKPQFGLIPGFSNFKLKTQRNWLKQD